LYEQCSNDCKNTYSYIPRKLHRAIGKKKNGEIYIVVLVLIIVEQ